MPDVDASAWKAVKWLNYPGDLTGSIIGKVMGHTMMGEFMITCEATYDATTDTTRVGFRYATVDEVRALREQGMGQR